MAHQGINPPQTLTVDQQTLSAMQNMLGSVLPAEVMPLVNMFMPMLSKGAKDLLKLSDSNVWNMMYSTDQTALGIAHSQLSNRINNLNAELAQGYAKDIQRVNYMAFYRMMNPGIADEDLNSKVDAAMSQGIRSALYQGVNTLFGFDEGPAVSQGMGVVASNIARSQYRRGGNYALAQTKDIMQQLFRDTASYARSEYGGMSVSERAAFAGLLTRDISILPGDVDQGMQGGGTDAESLKRATERVSKMTQEYSKAISPLKDLFGKDIPQMVATLEQLSGQTISHMGTERIAQISSALTTRIDRGVTSLQNIAGVSNVINQQLARRQGLGTYDRIGTERMAIMAEDMYNGVGVQGNWMSAAAWSSAAVTNTISVETSTGADAMAKAYAIWANEFAGDDKSFEAFTRQVNQAGGGINGALSLIYDPSGIRLDRGMAYDEYRIAKTTGMAGNFAMRQAANKKIVDVAQSLSIDADFKGAIKRDAAGAEQLVADYFRLLQSDPNLANMTSAELIAFLQSDKGGLLDADTAADMALAANYVKAKYADDTTFITQAAQRQKALEIESRDIERRRVTDKWTDAMYSSGNLLSQALLKATENGTKEFDWHRIIENLPLQEQFGALNVLEEDTRSTLEAATYAAAQTTAYAWSALAGNDKLTPEERIALAQGYGATTAEQIRAYGLSVASSENSSFIRYRKEYATASANNNQDAAARAAGMMYLYSTVSQDAVDSLLDASTNIYNARGELLTDKDARIDYILGRVTEGTMLQRTVSDVVREERFRAQAMSDKDLMGTYNAFSAWMTGENKRRIENEETILTLDTGLTAWAAEAGLSDEDRKKRESLVNKLTIANSGAEGFSAALKDTFGALPEVLNKLGELIQMLLNKEQQHE